MARKRKKRRVGKRVLEQKSGVTAEAFELKYYAVCLIDVLGQKEVLQQWSRFPKDGDPDASERFDNAVTASLGRVLRVRDLFRELYAKSAKDSSSIECLPAEANQIVRQMKMTRPQVMQFSDTIVFFSEVASNQKELLVHPLHQLLFSTAMMIPLLWAQGIPTRGAIHVGMGVKIADNDFYGPALYEAYHLESKVAIWPRIIVSEETMQFLSLHVGSNARNWPEELNKEVARSAMNLLLTNKEDGLHMVDFLSPAMAEVVGSEIPFASLIQNGCRFICEERERFAASMERQELAEKYSKLESYYKSRLPLWSQQQLSPESDPVIS